MGIRSFCPSVALPVIVAAAAAIVSPFGADAAGLTCSCTSECPTPNILSTVVHPTADLVLSGTDTLTIDKKKYIIPGKIVVSGDASLTILDSEIELQSGTAASMSISERATLTVSNSSFATRMLSHFSGQSSVSLDRVFLVNVNEFTEQAEATITNSCIAHLGSGAIGASGSASVEVADSVVGSLGLNLPSSLTLVVSDLQPGYISHWSVWENISSSLTFNIIVDRTELKQNPVLPGEVEMGWNVVVDSDARLTVLNSVLNKMVIRFNNENVSFSGLIRGQPTEFQYGAIQLTNTDVRGQWGIFASNGEVLLEDCDGVWLWPVGADGTTVVDSAVNEFDPRQYAGTVHMTNSSMTNGFEIMDNSVFRLEGSIDMREIGPEITAGSVMTRNYEVIVRNDATGLPVAGVDLWLSDNGSTVWTGRTDAGGSTDFDIPFDHTNYTNVWTLHTSDFSQPIAIDSDTPVNIVTPALFADGFETQDTSRWSSATP